MATLAPLDVGSSDFNKVPPAPTEGIDVEDLVFLVSKEGLGHVSVEALTSFLTADPLLTTVRDDKGWTPLLWASFYGHVQVVSAMLDNGGDARYRNWMSELAAEAAESKSTPSAAGTPVNSPLHWASFKGHTEVVWILLSHGFGVGDVDNCGNNCLHLATASGHVDVVKVLLCAGVDLSTPNWYGNTAVALASDGATRALLQRLSDQRRCAATNVYFGPEEPLYMCYCCSRGFTEDASFPQAVCGSLAPDAPLKPVRFCSECVFTIQEAEAGLDAALHPNRPGGELASVAPSVRVKSPLPRSPPTKNRSSRGGGEPGQSPSSVPDAEGGSDSVPSLSRLSLEPPGELLLGLEPLADAPRLRAALDRGVEVGADLLLVHTAKTVLARLEAGVALSTAVEGLSAKRPLSRRADASALVEAIRVAKQAHCNPTLIHAAEQVLASALAEVKLLGAVTNIPTATHANDGDVLHLRDALSTVVGSGGSAAGLVAEASSLANKLDAEISMSDCADVCRSALADLDRRVRKYAEEDPTELPLLPLEEGQDPATQKRMPTRQQQALVKVESAIGELQRVLEMGVANNANAALCAQAKADLVAAQATLKEATTAETARIAKFEDERIKREKKAKRGGAAAKKK